MAKTNQRYVALLRGINVGGNRKVVMAELRDLFVALGFSDVSTFINSGNVIFGSATAPDQATIETAISDHFGFFVDTLILSGDQLRAIASAIPVEWTNSVEQRSNAIFLFSDVETSDILEKIGYRPEIERMIYVPGAILATISRKNQSKGSLLKLMGTPLYRRLTIRNILTTRKLAEIISQ